MVFVKTQLMALSVYKNLLGTEPVQCLLRFCEKTDPDDLICAYTDLLYAVRQEGKKTLSESLLHHLKYDESIIGTAVAASTADLAFQVAAAADIRLLSGIGQLSCREMKRHILNACTQRSQEYVTLVRELYELPEGSPFDENEIFDSYRKNGCGLFALGRAFHWEKGALTAVKNPDSIRRENMIGYEHQRRQVTENTLALLAGKPANNVLLYGDSGTGKSATIKSLINIPSFSNLRLIEIAKNSLDELTRVIRFVSGHTQKFILYIDDLSFEQADRGFSALKTALEGGLELRPSNVVIYATSNRRHLIRESFSDRAGDEVHARETLEERSSLSERFGLRIAYLALDKQKYTDMVLAMCRAEGLSYDEAYLRAEANKWEMQRGGRTPRIARQLVDRLVGQENS